MNRIDEILNTITDWMNDIKQGLAEDVKKTSMNAKSQMRLGWIYDLHSATLKEERHKIGDRLASDGGGIIFTEYIRIFTENGKKDPPPGSDNLKSLIVIKSLCWNYSDVSINFCFELGKAGVFPLLVCSLERSTQLIESMVNDDDNLICSSLSILHNSAKDSRNKPFMIEAKVMQAVLPYSRIRNEKLIENKMIATLLLSYIMEEKDHDQITPDGSMTHFILLHLNYAMAATDHRFNGFSVEELVDGLLHLAGNDRNKISLVKAGILPLLVKLMEHGDASEKALSAATVWSLSFAESNKQEISHEKNMISVLEKLAKQPGEVGYLGNGALWCLRQQEESSNTKSEKTSPKTLHKSSAPAASCMPQRRHIMISYSKSHQSLVFKIKDQLEKQGYCVWIGTDETPLVIRMEAIENCDVFLFCTSQEYKSSIICRTEAAYAYKRNICMIRILAEPGYMPDGWLGALQSPNCFDFSDQAAFENVFTNLVKEIGNRGKITSIEKKEPSSNSSIENWTTEQVMEWATVNKIARRAFQTVDGESLAYLCDMKKSSPEFYHKYVIEKLELSELQDLKNLSRALDNLEL